jgi:hypothetical protein
LWALAFGLNLVVPLVFGWTMTSEGGRFGMAAAVGVLWYLGHRLCEESEECSHTLPIGGFIFAATQVCPILQISSGVLSVGIAIALGQGSDSDWGPPGIRTESGGPIATGLTGLTLIGAAAIRGAIVVRLTDRRPVVRLVPGSQL